MELYVIMTVSIVYVNISRYMFLYINNTNNAVVHTISNICLQADVTDRCLCSMNLTNVAIGQLGKLVHKQNSRLFLIYK